MGFHPSECRSSGRVVDEGLMDTNALRDTAIDVGQSLHRFNFNLVVNKIVLLNLSITTMHHIIKY